MVRTWARVLLLALLLCGAARAEVAVPPLAHRVTDLTGTLNPQQVEALESRLAAFEREKGAQLAVLIVPTTAPETIEQYSIRVAEAWKLGRKGVDDGALLLIAKDDRTLRIEVGYGLEGVLPDAIANRIIDEIIVPRFRQGEFYGGIDAGVSAMIDVIHGEPLPVPRPSVQAPRPVGGGYDIGPSLFIALGLALAFGSMLRAVLGRLPAALLMGGVLAMLAWLIVASVLFSAMVGVLAFVLVLAGGVGRGFTGYGGGFGGGFGGGGFGGGGGFSGGGGGFGGGGASGRW